MADWHLTLLGRGVGTWSLAWLLLPFAVALALAWRARPPRVAAEFDGRSGELGAWSVGLSLAGSDLALAGMLLALPLAASQPRGGLACLQGMLIGGVLGRWLVSRWFLPACFTARERTPLGWIEERLGRGAARWAVLAYAGGTALSVAARVFLLGFALHLAVGVDLGSADRDGGTTWIVVPLLAAWGIAGLLLAFRGLPGSVAGDGWLWLVLLASAVVGFVAFVPGIQGGWPTFYEVLLGARKHVLLQFETSPGLADTFWVALLVSSLASAAHYGTDPTQLTRLLATGSLERARKALWISLLGVLPALVACLIGAAVFDWSERHFLREQAALLYRARPDAIWPIHVALNLPSWAKLVVLAGFAVSAVLAAKAVLAAFVQLLSVWRCRRRGAEPSLRSQRRWILALSLLGAGGSAVLVPLIAWRSWSLPFALDASACTNGVLFAAAGLALGYRRVGAPALAWSAPLALAGVFALAVHGPRAEQATLAFAGVYFAAWIGWRFLPDWFGRGRYAAALAELAIVGAGLLLLVWASRWGFTPIERNFRYDPEWVWLPLASPWYVPAGGWIGFVFGCLLARGSAGSEGLARTFAR